MAWWKYLALWSFMLPRKLHDHPPPSPTMLKILSANVKPQPTSNRFLSELVDLVDELDFDRNSLSFFRSVLPTYYHKSVEVNYNPDDPRSFKTICLKCNTVRSLA